MLTIATNACPGDAVRLHHTVPSWLRTFDRSLREVIIAIDPAPPSGRIAHLQSSYVEAPDALNAAIDRLRALDSRVRSFVLDVRELEPTSRTWFLHGAPLRCQAGTPIYAFVRAIAAANPSDIVLRADCDMLFCEKGWLREAVGALEQGDADLIEPPRLGATADAAAPVSSRALLFRPVSLAARALPMPAHRLGWVRRFHRQLQGRPPWLAWEQMLDKERQSGRIRHQILAPGSGFSLHVARRVDMTLPWFPHVVSGVEHDQVPVAQVRAGENFQPSAWPESGATDDHRQRRASEAR